MDQLQQLAATREIEQLKARYCRFLDTKQWESWGELFTPDAVLDVSDDVTPDLGESVVTGRQKIVEHVHRFVHAARTAHQVHTLEIEFQSDTTATGIWAMEDMVRWEKGTPPVAGVKAINGFGHYHERYELRDGRWYIASLKLSRLMVTPV